jgi:hypothetical protein
MKPSRLRASRFRLRAPRFGGQVGARIRVALAALLLICFAPVGAQISTTPVFPGKTWEYVGQADLAAYGWSTEGLQKTSTFIRDSSHTTGLVVVHRGRVVYQYGDIQELSYVASVRKSFLSALYGYWVETGAERPSIRAPATCT